MIRKLLMTTAISLIATSGAMAAGEQKQAGVSPAAQEYLESLGEAALASNVMGATVYTSEADDAEVIGDINDLVVADDGSIDAAVIGVGGFLGVGEKNVAVSFESIRWVDKDGEQIAVLETTKEDLEAAPEFVPEETAMAPAEEPLAEEPAEGADDMAAAPAEEPAEGADDMAAAPAEEPAEGADIAEAPAEGADVAEAPAEEPAEATEDLAAAPAEEPAEGTYTEEPAEGADVAEAPAEEPAAGAEVAEAPAEEPAEATEDLAAAPAEEPAEGTDVAEVPAEEPAAGTDIAQAPVEEPLTQPDPSMAPTDQATGPVLTDVTGGSISAEQMIGATVYAQGDENVGDVGDVRLMADGSGIDAVIIDVGGFLGIGEKPVALAFEALTFKTDESGSLYVYTDFTRDELDAAPEYDETAYEAERETMRLSLRE
ncbi:MAG: PRC-barrel domain-containing protein [Propylenella sp.]